MAKQKSATDYRKITAIFFVIWIAILPVAMFVQAVTRFATVQVPEVEGVDTFINILSLLMGLYFFFGWIPVLVLYLKSRKQVK